MKSINFYVLISAYKEATSITFSLVFLPVIFLIIGFFLDKTFSSTPLFIVFGIIAGVIAGFWRGFYISSHYQAMRKNRLSNSKNKLK